MAKGKTVGNLLEKLVPVLLLASIALAFTVGILWQKVSNLEGKGQVAGAVNPTVNNNQPSAQGPSQGKLTSDQVKKIPSISDSDHIRGKKDAEVVLIEYSDYQCPFCSRFHPTVQQVVKEYGDKVAWVYRHFPLDQLHPKARPTAIASECVASLGGEEAFWKFTDEIFANQQTALDDLASVAAKAGVNQSSFKSCVDGKKFESVVEEVYQGGSGAGVTGTPGNFIVNKKGDAWLIPGALPYESIKATIEEALKS